MFRIGKRMKKVGLRPIAPFLPMPEGEGIRARILVT